MTPLQQKIEALSLMEQRLRAAPVEEIPDAVAARESVLSFLRVCRTDAMRRQAQEPGSLAHLYKLKRAMQDGAEALRFAYVQNADDLAGWFYSMPARNQAQWLAGTLNELLLSLTASIVEIEERFPHLRERFDQERAERARAAATA